MEECESYGEGLATQQRDVMFHLADLVRYAESRWPDTWMQIFPPWVSPGMLARVAAVGKAYPTEESRSIEAPYTIYMRESNKVDRIQRVQAHVDAGRNSDEARKADQAERAEGRRRPWLMCVDVNYWLTRTWSSGAGVEAAMQVAQKLERTVKRLKEKGLTDVLCCLDSPHNFRHQLTEQWEDGYKPRASKDPELVEQLRLMPELLTGLGFCCAQLDGFEADDLMASAAIQFNALHLRQGHAAMPVRFL
jgi:hypothetical protein